MGRGWKRGSTRLKYRRRFARSETTEAGTGGRRCSTGRRGLTLASREAVQREEPRWLAKRQALNVLSSIKADLAAADWYSEGWLDEVLNQVALSFDRACDRWRDLYRAAAGQQVLQNRITLDNSRPIADRDKAKRLRAEAEAQIRLLEGSEKSFESDFYSYRYFASEDFLPG